MIERICWLPLILALLVQGPRIASADSALDLLSGFDAERLDASYPPSSEAATSELAKLLYRLRKADTPTLSQKAKASAVENIGDAVTVDGHVQAIRNMAVPPRLIEFLEFEQFQELTIVQQQPADGEALTLRVVASSLPGEAKTGDRVAGVGVVIELTPSAPPLANVVAVGHLQWFPAAPASPGWRLLSQHGVDVSALADVSTRNRQPLMPEDADAFYPMLAAAKEIGAEETEKPQNAKPLDLLREPTKFSGDWLTMQLNTVRVTRVSVTDPIRQEQLGSDHYFQIDAMGDLGNVVVQIERPEGTSGEPIRFENTYPVSLVIADLPESLANRIRQQEGGDAVVSMISVPIRVNGFFFRLWSYSTDFMDRRGGGDQFGPLMVVAQMTDLEVGRADGVGVEVIGYIAAAAVILGIIAVVIWTRRTERDDDRERKKRRDREAEELQLPSDL